MEKDAEKWTDEGPIAGQDGGTCTPLLGGRYLAYLYAMVLVLCIMAQPIWPYLLYSTSCYDDLHRSAVFV
ncbi:hypothetical protein AAC387_Pa11g0917 [Persea americana]